MNNLYEQAEERVNSDPLLKPHAEFILADWPEGDEHWNWIINATIEEILDWIPDTRTIE